MASDTRKFNITLLAGGISAEREISLLTGGQIADALRKAGHRVWQADISPDDLSALDQKCDLVFPALQIWFLLRERFMAVSAANGDQA